ncbi:hypothetical protein TrST_g5116 [Triparma strigata]|uniref:Uncharacterized protein n=1 Tax=Triparma strigata TaxID=1606541 RepID=A0A9W7B6V9_9STRA|nr:hypothetical protein TrST_g5116 [Triparma strigata]|eukprot:CAMPEP_0182515922 /NCGR_PEP_ID=MMETSP1321-20130603/39219_1 /TAXON_ID=91990 /ORGANISM="Bolidomonas sp., Strain RCC1657" /LENGTH=397 /DNA_ID=CAMNT_0024723425 /DNA_START=15 /DNA_END=1208 /DNA_ORIENTATION=+
MSSFPFSPPPNAIHYNDDDEEQSRSNSRRPSVRFDGENDEGNELPMDTLKGLARRSSYASSNGQTIIRSMNDFIVPPLESDLPDEDESVAPSTGPFDSSPTNNAAQQAAATGQLVKSLRAELQQTQQDLVKAMQGWRDDRVRFDAKVKAFKESEDVKKIKQEHTAEKAKLRNQIASLKKKEREFEEKYTNSCKEYEARLQSQMARVLDAEYRGKEEKKVMRRRSSIMKQSQDKATMNEEAATRRAKQVELELENARAEIVELKNEVRGLYREMESANYQESARSEAMNNRLKKEIERLKQQLKGKVRRPSRSVPKPPVPSGGGSVDEVPESSSQFGPYGSSSNAGRSQHSLNVQEAYQLQGSDAGSLSSSQPIMVEDFDFGKFAEGGKSLDDLLLEP